jgi:hypothetical protein
MAGRRRVKINDLNKAVAEILEEYGDNFGEATKKAVLEVAKIAKQETQAGAPVRSGKYRSGWAVKEEAVDRFRTDAIVHNRTRYQLAHLLEKGHALRKGGRSLGSVGARVHIAPAEQNAIKNLEEAIGKIAQQG